MLHLKPMIDIQKPIGNWTLEPDFRDRVMPQGLAIFLSGLQANHPELGSVTGSSADLGTHPIDFAWFELLERISIMENVKGRARESAVYPLYGISGDASGRSLNRTAIFPTSASSDFHFSKSNGVALHGTWEEACRRACFELVERHLVLSSWVGLTCPQPIVDGNLRSPLNTLKPIYDIKRVNFGQQLVSCYATPISVSGVVLIPRSSDAPLIVAFGAGFSGKDSLQKAEAEAIQRLGFLWGEEIPTTVPEFSPSNLYHQDYFLMPAQRGLVEHWVDGDFAQKGRAGVEAATPLMVDFADLTRFPELGMKVAKAVSAEAIPLVFGLWREREFKDLPEERLIHPIA